MHAVQFSLRSSYCLLRTVVWTLFCFTRSVFIVSSQCFVSWWQFCPLTGGFQVGDLGCSAAFSSIVVLPAEYARTVGSTLIRFSRKELLYRWCLLRVKSIIWSIFIVFFPVLFLWWQFCPLIGEFYVSGGWFFDFSLIIWGKPSSSQSQITSLKSKITNLKHNSLINGHNCHHKTKQRQEIKL